MKLIAAFIQPARLDCVSQNLLAAKIFDMTITTCCGHGRDQVLVPSFRGGPDAPDLLPALLLEVIVPERKAQQAVAAIMRGARSGSCGAGKIFISALERVVRIDSGNEVAESVTERTKIRRVRTPAHHPSP